MLMRSQRRQSADQDCHGTPGRKYGNLTNGFQLHSGKPLRKGIKSI